MGELLGSEAGDELQDLVFEQLAAMAETGEIGRGLTFKLKSV